MAILNITPDSFYEGSRANSEQEIVTKTLKFIEEGARIIDIGAYSSRPGAENISIEEEKKRLSFALKVLTSNFKDLIISVDTFRADVAKMVVEEFGVAIINDISGGEMDTQMFDTIAKLNVPYILMHCLGTPQTMQINPIYSNVNKEVMYYFSEKLSRLHYLGVKDIILDPGFGFGKTIEHNYEILNYLQDYRIFEKPLLVGFSRKSMIYKSLNINPENALNGTTVLNTIALSKGAHILRVHDVKEAVEAVKLWQFTTKN